MWQKGDIYSMGAAIEKAKFIIAVILVGWIVVICLKKTIKKLKSNQMSFLAWLVLPIVISLYVVLPLIQCNGLLYIMLSECLLSGDWFTSLSLMALIAVIIAGFMYLFDTVEKILDDVAIKKKKTTGGKKMKKAKDYLVKVENEKEVEVILETANKENNEKVIQAYAKK